jgi:hypothetical protein
MVMINYTKVYQAVELQKDMNADIELFGSTTPQKLSQLEHLIDNFNSAEGDTFIALICN